MKLIRFERPQPIVRLSTAAAVPSPEDVTQSQTAPLPLNLEVALDLAVRAAAQKTGAMAVIIALRDSGALVCRARLGEIAPDLGASLDVNAGITGMCVRTAEVLKCDDTEMDKRVDAEVCRRLGIKSILVVPIRVEGAVAGLVEALSAKPMCFGPADVAWLLKVASFVANVAFDRATAEDFHNGKDYPRLASSFNVKVSKEPSTIGFNTPQSTDQNLAERTGVSALAEVLNNTLQMSGWDDICPQLVSRLRR